jgi:hypothetical protein
LVVGSDFRNPKGEVRMRYVILKLVSCAILLTFAVAGCNRAEPDFANHIDIEHIIYWPTHEAKLTNGQIAGIDAGSVYCVFEHKPEKTPIAIVWFDGPYQSRRSGSESSPKDPSSAYSTVFLEGNNKVQIDCFKANEPDRPMEFKIDGKQYDLEDGNFFLVSTHGERFRLLQTRRDLEELRFERNAMASQAKSDKEILEFFAAATDASQ